MKNKLDVVKITFTGIGTNIFKYNLSNETLLKLERTAKLFYLPLEVAIFDGDFFKYLNDKSITCLNDFKKEFCEDGMLDSTLMQIDLWYNSRRRHIIRNLRLENSISLFPLYNIHVQKKQICQTQEKMISISESYIGLIKTYKIITEDFDLDKLVFNISDVEMSKGNNQTIISSISYDGQIAKNLASDNLITNRITIIE